MDALKGCLMAAGLVAILIVGSCTVLGYGTYKVVEQAAEDGTLEEWAEEAEARRRERERGPVDSMDSYGIEEYSPPSSSEDYGFMTDEELAETAE